MRPEQALAAARQAAAAARAQGLYAQEDASFVLALPDRHSHEQLVEWAVIEPDRDLVRSTRPWGRPITAFKQAVLHVLRQYLSQLESQQSRFNVHMLVRLAELEDRVADLEYWAGRREDALHASGQAPPPPARRTHEGARLAAELDLRPAGGDEIPEVHRRSLP